MSPATPSRRILIVDDDGAIRESLASGIAVPDVEVRLAHDGEQAFAQVSGAEPTLPLVGLARPSGRAGKIQLNSLDAQRNLTES